VLYERGWRCRHRKNIPMGTSGPEQGDPAPATIPPVSQRLAPYDLVFAPLAEERFSAIRAALSEAGRDPQDRDAFLLAPDAAELVHQLRPDEGLGEDIDRLAALVHHAFLYWAEGSELIALNRNATNELLDARPQARNGPVAIAPYVQVPERLIWARPLNDQAYEPLDGWFAHLTAGGVLRALAVFGLHPDRMGFTVVEATGPRPQALARPDGSPLFAPALRGGEAAGLREIVGSEELLELAWRVRDAGKTR
jgi:hypothetical protein